MSTQVAAEAANRPTQVALETPFRAYVYGLLSQAFAFPDEKLYALVSDGSWYGKLNNAMSQLTCRLRTSDLCWAAPIDYDAMQTEYIRLFQIGGRRGPPCPLHAGHYGTDRAQELRRLISFYLYFGFRVTESTLPDHISAQLEFMSELSRYRLGEPDSLLRAQRDFLNRLTWFEELSRRLAKVSPAPFYRSLVTLSVRFIAAERRYVQNKLAGG